MTTNKPEVAAYRYTASRSFGKRNPKWHYQESFPNAENRKVEEIGRLEKLIRLSDYEVLQAECDTLVEALSALRGCIMETRGPDAHSALVLADAALATYHNQKDNNQ